MTAPAWADAEWSPFGVALEPVYEAPIEFGVAAAPVVDDACESCAEHNPVTSDCLVTKPELDDTGAPVIEWAPATREQLADGDTVRVTQVGRWKGTRLVGKTTHYERKPAPTT